MRKQVEGQKYNRLLILRRTRKTSYDHWYVEAECDCGTVKEIKLYSILSGAIKSCGCLNVEKLKGNKRAKPRHGMYETGTYQAWEDMKARCRSERLREYYQDRGITVCEKWQTFEGFYEDMGEKPENTTLDRIDNDKGYYPENCRWTTRQIQSANTRVLRRNNTSGYRGVGWHKAKNKWRAYISLQGKYKHLGLFTCKEDAARAYNREAKKHEGYPLNEV